MNTNINFYDWLTKLFDEPTPVGDFANDARDDERTFPKNVNNLYDLIFYLESKNACDTAIKVGRDAFIQYAKEQTGVTEKELMFNDMKDYMVKRQKIGRNLNIVGLEEIFEAYGIDTEGDYEIYNRDDETIMEYVSQEAIDLINQFMQENKIISINVDGRNLPCPLLCREM